MFRWLLLLIIIVPAMEIGILVWAGNLIGPWWVILLIISTGILGAYLAKQQGLETLNRARDNMQMGMTPQDELINGVCILIGAAVLLTPGFITDAIGFTLLLPVTREPIKKGLMKVVRRMMDNGTITVFRK
ncbi:membrane protein FxsA [Pontibacillus yanchengensis]|uniref:Membrane protein FxsA n=2 Tax=Pontibacillus yanchengensis TaxID=462910 RepID=A0ACC7VF59_9BACI|nr:FxsA family protein [Pontibacillus yanchengensis]MYL34142.1 membrane protein FxsA [Pontibacillus yanchengensis]MYL53235.1 membrane protein FxsA [Pontibacillus yanchengensis]